MQGEKKCKEKTRGAKRRMKIRPCYPVAHALTSLTKPGPSTVALPSLTI